MMSLPVLRRVRQLEKKLMITDNRLPAVREVLARFSDKLSQARSLLQAAADHVQETHDRNRANDLKVLRSQVRPGHAPSLSVSWRSSLGGPPGRVWMVGLDGWMDG